MKRVVLKIGIVLLIGILIGGGVWLGVSYFTPEQGPDDGYPVQINGLTLEKKPEHICSLSPGITDALRELGAAKRVRWISDFCSDKELREAKRVGSLYAPDFHILSEQTPELCITLGAPSDAVAERMRILDIPLLSLSPAADLSGLKRNVEWLSMAVFGRNEGKEKMQRYEVDLNYQLSRCRSYTKGQKVSVLWLTGDGAKAVTEDTLGGSLLKEAGFENAAKGAHFAWNETELPEGDYRLLIVDEALWNSFSEEKKTLLTDHTDGRIFLPDALLERQSIELLSIYESLQLELDRLGAKK